MREKSRENQTIRTVRRKRIQDLLAVLFFLLLLPYTCSVVGGIAAGGDAVKTMAGAKQGPYFYREEKNGTWQVPVEEYLVGALAATVPGDYRTEVLKAQAVILRSACMAEPQGEDMPDYLDLKERKEVWGEDFEENKERFSQAVSDTSGIVLTWEGEAVSPPFFRLSAGKTRSGAEIFEDDVVCIRPYACRLLFGAHRPAQLCALERAHFFEGEICGAVTYEIGLHGAVHAHIFEHMRLDAPDGRAAEVCFREFLPRGENAARHRGAAFFIRFHIGGLKGLHRIGERRPFRLARDRLRDLLALYAGHIFDLKEHGRFAGDFFQKFGKEGNALGGASERERCKIGGGESGDFARSVRHAVDGVVVKDGELLILGKAHVGLDGVARANRRAEGGKAVFGAPVAVQAAVRDGNTC